jgi:tetratricopeptide (TPR) repeat protein
MAVKTSSARRLRKVAAGCSVLGVLLVIAMVYCAFSGPHELVIPYLCEGVAFLLLGIGLGSGLKVLADLYEARTDSMSLATSHSEMAQQLGQLRSSINEALSPASSLSPNDQVVFSRIDQALEEIREFTLMTDREREERLHKVVEQRKRQLANEVMELIGKQEWARAENHVTMLETHFPTDPYTTGCRRDLNIARKAAEYDAVLETRQRVEGLVMMESYDAALASCTKLVENFPSNADARALLQRITREREIHIDANGQKLFEDIRVAIDRREWKHALTLAHRMLNRFPHHVRTLQIRDQFETIQDNAEIQERQEIEVQIEELVRSNRYAEAIGLGEDVVRRFPHSPQAQTLQGSVLPRLREVLQQDGQPAF